MTAGKLSLNTSNIAPCSSNGLLKRKGIYSNQEKSKLLFLLCLKILQVIQKEDFFRQLK